MKIFSRVYNKINQILDDIAAHLGLEHRAIPVRIQSKNRKSRDKK